MKIKELITLEVETYSCSTHDFTEYTLRSKCDPWLLVQLLAFNGVAYSGERNMVHVTDWETIPPEILADVRQTTFTSFNSVLSGRIKPEKDGSFILKSVGVEATVQHGKISFPDPKEVKKKATNLQRKSVF